MTGITLADIGLLVTQLVCGLVVLLFCNIKRCGWIGILALLGFFCHIVWILSHGFGMSLGYRRLLSALDVSSVMWLNYLLVLLFLPKSLSNWRFLVSLALFSIFSVLVVVTDSDYVYLGAFLLAAVYSAAVYFAIFSGYRMFRSELYSVGLYSRIERLLVYLLLPFQLYVFSSFVNGLYQSDFYRYVYSYSGAVIWIIVACMCYVSSRGRNRVTGLRLDFDVNVIAGFGNDDLDRLFEETKIYLNPNLSLEDVAREMGTNRTYLSAYLNKQRGIGFSDYVNAWRAANMAKMLRDSSMLSKSVQEISRESGFLSVATARRAFMKNYTLSPSDYRDRRLA